MAKKKSSSKKKSGGKKAEKKEVEVVDLHPETKKWIVAIAIFVVAALSFLSLFGLAGPLGEWMLRAMELLLGRLEFLIPIVLAGIGYIILKQEEIEVKTINYVGFTLFLLSLAALFNIFVPREDIFTVIDQGGAGGYLGLIFSYATLSIVGFVAALIIIIAILIIGLLLTFNSSLEDLAESPSKLGRMVNWFSIKWYDLRYGDLEGEDDDADEDTDDADDYEDEEYEEPQPFKQKVLASSRKLKEKKEDVPVLEKPKKVSYKKVDLPLDLLEMSSGTATPGNIARYKEKIQRTLESFNIPVTMGDVNVGPTVTQYELIPAEGVKLSRITALQDDLALALAAHPLRIEAPIPGKSAVGVEIPNTSVATVRLRELLESKPFKSRASQLTVPLGKDVSGKAWVASIERMPHLLVAGATGSGKSVCLNTIIVSLLYQNSPETLRFIMVDPKKVELSAYENVPHLLTPVITDVKKTVNALKWCVAEMDRRYTLLQKMGKRNLESYNKTVEEKLPYIVFIIDEMADLMVAARNDVEGLIIRLAQMARAVGIHLVLATQRPSVDVITGLIKANVPTRIAFAVASSMDSRTILDSVGADKLVGKGDMLFSNPEHKKPVRIQGAFLSEDEVRAVVEYLKENGEEPDFNEEVTEKAKNSDGSIDFSDPDEGDELFEEAKEVIISAGKASTSYLQRRLKIGYSRAARIMDLLEEAGIIGPQEGSKPREILVTEREIDDDGFDVQESDDADLYADSADGYDEEAVDDADGDADDAVEEETDDGDEDEMEEDVIDEGELEEEEDEDDEWLRN